MEGQAGARGGVTACPSGERTVPSIVKGQVLCSVWSSGSVLNGTVSTVYPKAQNAKRHGVTCGRCEHMSRSYVV